MTRSTAARSAERQSNHVAAALEAKIDNIERLLAHHEAKGNIGPWERIPGVSRRWNVTLHDGVDLSLRTVSEAHVFVCGLRSADEAAAARQNPRASGPR